MNQLKSIYNNPFKSLHSHPIHTCLATIASNEQSENDCIYTGQIKCEVLTTLPLKFKDL